MIWIIIIIFATLILLKPTNGLGIVRTNGHDMRKLGQGAG